MNRYYPVLLDRSKVGKKLVDLFEPRFAASCGGADTPELHEIAADPFVYQAFSGAARMNMESHRVSGKQVSRAAGSLFTDPTFQQYWHMYRWHRTGAPIYDLDNGLAAAFLDTELRVSGGDVEIPLPTMYIAVPPSLGLEVWNELSGTHQLDGFFVSQSGLFDRSDIDEEDGDISFDIVADVGGSPARVTNTFDRSYRRFVQVLAIGLPQEGKDITDNALASFPLPLDVADFESLLDSIGVDPRFTMGLVRNASEMRKWFRIILNTFLYLSSDGADVEQRRLGPSEGLRRKAKKMGRSGKRLIESATLPVRYFRVGHRLSVSDEVRTRGQASEATRELTKRFMVRGHWRHQAHGPGRKERKLLWIAPFWKGPPWAEVAAAHVVKLRPPT